MALLQIAEPGRARHDAEPRRALGIDLGTTNSLVATVRQGRPQTLPDEGGDHLLPSVVYYATTPPLVGAAAMRASAQDPAQGIASVKRLMGRTLSDAEEQGRFLQELKVESGSLRLQTAAGWVSPVQVSAEILKVLAERGRQALGGDPVGVVITVPAYFDDAQRQATRDAARLAGLKVLRLLNEPTAAAVAYGLDHGAEGLHVVYDLGGGTFDVSVLRLQRGVFEVLATGGDTALGGDDFDRAIAAWILARTGWSTPDLQQRHAALVQARELKHQLSYQAVAEAHWPGGRAELTRSEFESMIQPAVDRTLRIVRRALRDAGVNVEEVREVVMVGGSTRVPRVQAEVEKLFQRRPLTHIDPDRVVALGAALQADALVGNKPDVQMLLLDVLPLSLGIETMGGLIEKILPRNTTLPARREQEFTTFKDGQTAMSFHVVQGERERVADARSLAHFELRGLPARVAGALKVRVSFQVDADGLLSVSAMEPESGQRAEVMVKPSYGLAEEEIAAMLRQAFDQAAADQEVRRRLEAEVDARRLLEALHSALAVDGDILLAADERARITALMEKLAAALQTATELSQVYQDLLAASEDYAARRMDKGMAVALSGRHVDAIDQDL